MEAAEVAAAAELFSALRGAISSDGACRWLSIEAIDNIAGMEGLGFALSKAGIAEELIDGGIQFDIGKACTAVMQTALNTSKGDKK